MKATLFKEVGYTLNKLLQDIEAGEIGLPDIQRPFIWKPARVRDLFDSMYKGFPVGYLLFWANGGGNGHRQIGVGAKQVVPRLLIVDGQQRLTSLYAVLKDKPVLRDDYTQLPIAIAFRPRDEKFEVTDAAIRKDPEFIADISILWREGVSEYHFITEFIQNLRRHREVDKEDEGRLAANINRLYDIQNYPFTALELSSTVDEEQVSDVFVRINSQGVTLNQADFILTLMSVFWDEGRMQLEQFCRAARHPSEQGSSPFNHFILPSPDQLLRVSMALGFRRARLEHVYSVLRGKDMETGVFSADRRVQQFATFIPAQSYALDNVNWHEFFKCLLRAGYRGSSMVNSQVALLYSYALYLIGKRDYGVARESLREIIARWFFMSALTQRYTTSPETAMEADLARLRQAHTSTDFVAILDGIVCDTLTDDFWGITLPNQLATSAARSPALFAYFAALNLLEAKVLFSKLKVSELLDPSVRSDKAALERHHLFARGYLRSIGITDLRQVNQIANYAIVEWADNIEISDQPPSVYVPKHEAGQTPEDLAQMRYWHALPVGWQEMPYSEFLASRRRLMAQVIRDGFARLQRAS